jgi:tetratricopeptide (TPR) repeat protein
MNLRILVCLILLTTGTISSYAQNASCDAFYHGANHRFAGRWDDAIAELTKAIDLKCPDLGRAYHLRAEARWGKKDYAGAWADATKAIPLLDEPALGHRLRGQLAFARSDLKTALMEFTKAIELDPDGSGTYILRAETHQELQNEEGAVADYAKVLQLGGDGVPADYLARAKAHLAKAAVSAHYTKGLELFHEGKAAEAIAAFTRAITADPKRPEYYAARADANISLRKLPAAMLDLDRSITLGGTYQANASRASIHIERGSYDKAISDLHEAVRLSKASQHEDEPLSNDSALAGAYDLSGKASVYKPAHDAETRQYFFYNGLYESAKNDKSSGKYGLALAKFSAAIGYFPDKVEFLAERGQIWLELGKPQLGLADFDRSLVVAPKIIYVHIYRSQAFYAMKRYADAFEAADIAIDRLPDDDPSLPDAYAARAAANCALGKKQAAAEDEGVFGMLTDPAKLKTRCR